MQANAKRDCNKKKTLILKPSILLLDFDDFKGRQEKQKQRVSSLIYIKSLISS